jgi:Ni/Co efflux regulator RcnB
MKRPAVYLLALSLLASAATFAAADPYKAREAHQKLNPVLRSYNGGNDRGHDNRGNDRGHDNRGNDHGNDNRGHDRRDNDNRGHDRPNWDRRDNDHRNDHRGNDNRGNDRRDWDHNRNDWNDHRGNDRPNWDRHDYRDNRGSDNRGWDRYRNDWNRHPNYYDNRRHDRADYARYRFHYGYYNRPYNYYSRSWHRGDRLPRGWYGSSYIVYDWRPYRLYAPPYGYHWVRVGDDVILTAVATGIVLDVIYNIWY